MEEIVQILMRRDGITERDAWELIDQCQEEINDLLRGDSVNINDVEDAVACWLGLEPDYLIYFLS